MPEDDIIYRFFIFKTKRIDQYYRRLPRMGKCNCILRDNTDANVEIGPNQYTSLVISLISHCIDWSRIQMKSITLIRLLSIIHKIPK